jgi:hypothetical protein
MLEEVLAVNPESASGGETVCCMEDIDLGCFGRFISDSHPLANEWNL